MIVGRQEFVDQSLLLLGLLDDPFLVILAQRPAQLVVVHCRPVLSDSPVSSQVMRRLDLESPLVSIHPADAAAVFFWLVKQLAYEVPEMDGATGAVAGQSLLRFERCLLAGSLAEFHHLGEFGRGGKLAEVGG